MRKPRPSPIPPAGFYVMGSYTSCAWFLRREDAEALCKHLNYRGGTVYRVESDGFTLEGN